MVGTKEDPGLMVLSLRTIFDLINKHKSSNDFEVSCSYLEVYNEVGVLFQFIKFMDAYLILFYQLINFLL